MSDNINPLELEVADILLMDKGTAGYTSYNFTPEVAGFIMDKNLFDCKMGHIHSHNVMRTFFSGVDMDELNDNCPNYDIYLSLIVNNFDESCAKIAQLANVGSYTVKDEKGEDYKLSLKGGNKAMFLYDVNVIWETTDLSVDSDIIERTKTIIEAAKAKPVTQIVQGDSKNTVSKRDKDMFPDFKSTSELTKEEEDGTDAARDLLVFFLGKGSYTYSNLENAIAQLKKTDKSGEKTAKYADDNFEVIVKNFFLNEPPTNEELDDIVNDVLDLLADIEEDILTPIYQVFDDKAEELAERLGEDIKPDDFIWNLKED